MLKFVKKNRFLFYVLTQNLILVGIPLLLALTFKANSYANTIEHLAGYSSGISGFLLMFVLEFIYNFEGIASSIIFLFIKYILFNLMFIATYKILPFVFSFLINVLLTIWCLLFGVFLVDCRYAIIGK